MKIEAVDFFYLSMPVVRDIGDGSQDALLVRVTSDTGLVGWGECEAAPLASIAAWCCPMSHSACKPVSASVLGQRVDSAADILQITALVRGNSLDLLQADHTLSGIDIALWDLLGKKEAAPVYALLGVKKAFPKTAYASQLFGDDPAETFAKGERATRAGIKAAKFGSGPTASCSSTPARCLATTSRPRRPVCPRSRRRASSGSRSRSSQVPSPPMRGWRRWAAA